MHIFLRLITGSLIVVCVCVCVCVCLCNLLRDAFTFMLPLPFLNYPHTHSHTHTHTHTLTLTHTLAHCLARHICLVDTAAVMKGRTLLRAVDTLYFSSLNSMKIRSFI